MSCSTTSLLAGTITTNTLTIEDPYIFTETVPTTPPTLFSNSQKSRSRFELKPQQQHQKSLGTGVVTVGGGAAATALRTTTQTAVNKESFYVKGRNHGAQTQTSPIATTATGANLSKSTTTQTNVNPPTAVLGVLNTNNIKKYETKTSKLLQQPPQRQQKHAQNIFTAQNENIIEKQQQQQSKLLSSTPPPLLLSHTPSLWQTPLLLESTTTATATSTAPAAVTVKKESTIKLHPFQISPQPPTPTLTATAPVTPTITVPAAAAAAPATVAATVNGNIAPLHLLMPSATPLPPSNFHHTTLAQHLQKLQCLKKPKKTNPQITATAPTPTSAAVTSLTSPAIADVKNTPSNQQHSANDLNEIPVNVIFRAASAPAPSQNVQALTGANVETPFEKESTKSTLTTTRPSISVCNTKRQNLPPPKQRQVQKCIVTKTAAATTLPGAVPTSPIVLNSSTKIINSKKPTVKNRQVNVPLAHPKKQKRFRKTNFFPSSLNERERAALAMVPDISLSTKAVAIIKRPFNEFAKDSTSLTDEHELPFCVQKHWFTIQQDPTLSGALSREERINEYKNVLRRQAMQLLATRSLQRLPFHVARKRLLCVDALLRKYRDHNKSSSAPSKLCEIEYCKNTALAMATVCQQHMAKNSKQSIFVLCSAKNFKENSEQTTCNIPVLNIQKQYAPPLCYLHLGQQQQQQQQQQRPNNVINGKAYEPKINTSKVSWTKSNTTVATRKRKFSSVSGSVGNAMPENNTVKTEDTPQLVSRMNMQRKNSTTSLESIASNSHSSFGSTVKTITPMLPMHTSITASNMPSPPALAPLSYNTSPLNMAQMNERQNRTFPAGTIDPVAEQEINKLVAQFAMAAAAKSAPTISNGSGGNNNANNNNNFNSFNFMNTNSNSNLTSSGVGSSSSLPSTDELLTQDMLSNCENSSAYASSSEDTGLGELSESELMAVSSIAENIDVNAIASSFSNIVSVEGSVGAVGVGVAGGSGGGSGFNDDDVGPDEIPLGDTRLLEENDLVNVFGTLPVNLNELFNSVVQQDEREEVERALEIADKHLRTLQQTIGSDTDFLADLLDVNDDMLVDTDDICSKMEIVSSVLPPNESLEAAALYLENAEKVLSNGGGVGCGSGNNITSHHQVAAANITMPTNCAGNNGANNAGVLDVRGLLQT